MLVSSGARERFDGLIEGEEEFSHHGGEGQFVRFAFGAQTLVKVRQDRVEACGRECSHVEAATQSGGGHQRWRVCRGSGYRRMERERAL